MGPQTTPSRCVGGTRVANVRLPLANPLSQIWDMGDQFKCLRTLTGHDGIVLALCLYK